MNENPSCTVKAVEHIAAGFPANAGRQFANALQHDTEAFNCEPQLVTIDYRGVPARTLISAFFNAAIDELYQRQSVAEHNLVASFCEFNVIADHDFIVSNIQQWLPLLDPEKQPVKGIRFVVEQGWDDCNVACRIAACVNGNWTEIGKENRAPFWQADENKWQLDSGNNWWLEKVAAGRLHRSRKPTEASENHELIKDKEWGAIWELRTRYVNEEGMAALLGLKMFLEGRVFKD